MRRVVTTLGCLAMLPIVLVILVLYSLGLLPDVDAAMAAVEEGEGW